MKSRIWNLSLLAILYFTQSILLFVCAFAIGHHDTFYRDNSLLPVLSAYDNHKSSSVHTNKFLRSFYSPSVTTCTTYDGSNVNSQNYTNASKTVKSYLSNSDAQTIMRVQGDAVAGVLVEYYDLSYNLKSTKIIAEELPIFGGFYETSANYFIISGQMNHEQSDTKEVIRVTKYDKSWNKVSIASLSDCNTVGPFYSGSLRVAQSGDYLIIRTSHLMYTSADGLNHQANMTFQVNFTTAPMTVTDKQYKVYNTSTGYASHSFNQFIRVENNKILAIDHGDGYPRSIVLFKYGKDVSSGTFYSYCTNINLLSFSGEIGNNVTGASVGGFDISSTHYLVAGNSVLQDDIDTSRMTRNIFVASSSKNNSEVTMNWITNMSEGMTSANTPHLVKIDTDLFLLLWSQGDQVYYTQINASGAKIGSTYNFAGTLSDCVPVVLFDKITWYTWSNEIVKFYEISVPNLSDNNVETITNGHKFVNEGIVDGYANLRCTVCNTTSRILVPTGFYIYWNNDGGGVYQSWFKGSYDIGVNLKFMISGLTPSGANSEYIVTIADDNIVRYDANTRSFLMLAKGITRIRIESKYNPNCYYEYNVLVLDPNDPTPDIHYRTHVQNIGWQTYKSNGDLSGTSGRSLRLEGINIFVSGASGLGVQYTTHVEDYGWLPWSSDNRMSGTEGQSKRLEAIKIQLTGANKDLYDIYYRVHAQDFGWLDWAANGSPAGTAGYSKRLEGIEILLVEKNGPAPGPTSRAFVDKNQPQPINSGSLLAYQTHIQDVGWQELRYDQQMSGTSGRSLRLEGIKIHLMNQKFEGDICYATHVQDIGWQEYVNNGKMSGTSGRSLRLEGIKILLTGDMANHFDVYYRVHIQDYGWLGWAKNGEESGSQGHSKRLEGIEIVLVEKDGSAPGSTNNCFIR